MKILHIAPQSPRKNGIVDYAGRYRSLINKYTEHKIDLFVYDGKVTRCDANITQVMSLYKISRKLAKELSKNRYDIIHAEIGSTCYPEFYLVLFLSLQNTPIPIVITFHDPPHLILDPIKYFGLSKATLISRVFKRVCSLLFTGMMEKQILNKSKVVFVLSEVGQKVACQRFKKQCDIFVPLKHFIFNEIDKDAHSIKKQNIILSAGFWTPRRGVEILLDALCLLREKSPEVVRKWKVYISGGILDDVNSKNYYHFINKMIKSGNWGDTIVTNIDLPICLFDDLFKQAAIYVASDVHKGRRGAPASGNLLRAIGHGCALIASDMPGRTELVEEEVNGLLYPPNDSEKLFHNLNVLLNSEETIKTFQLNNINISKTKYDGKSVINKFIYYYDTIVNK